nr:CzcE family metal-binding protein [Massilia sp. JS1662]
MKIRSAILSLAALAATAPVLAHAACDDTFRNGACLYGEPATGAPMRTVDLSTTRSIAVKYGETVRFVDGDHAFAWTFDGLGQRAVPLAKVAPAGVDTHAARVYIAAGGEPQE